MLRVSRISFPGFGIKEFDIDAVAFSVGGFEIAWYAIIITIGMIVGVYYTIYRCNQAGITFDDAMDFCLFAIPIGVVGARLYYVLTTLEEFDTFYDVINIRAGGLAIYGGILAGAVSVFVTAKVKKIPFLVIADCCTPGIILAQAIGRWGNFTNGEAFGAETGIFCRMGLNNFLTSYETVFVHPTFLYESLWNLAGFLLMHFLFKKRKYDGQIFLMIFGWYGLGRMFIEGLRADSLYTTIFSITFRTSQVLAAVIFIICAAFLTYFAIKKYEKPLYHKDNINLSKESK